MLDARPVRPVRVASPGRGRLRARSLPTISSPVPYLTDMLDERSDASRVLGVVLAVPGGLSPLQHPVDLVRVWVSPFAHPVLEAREQNDRNRIGRGGATAPFTILASVGMNGDCAGIGPVMSSTGSPYGRGISEGYPIKGE